MGKLLKSLLTIIVVLLLVAAVVFVYLNLIYLPQKVKAEGPDYLKEKTKDCLRAQSIEYIPFKGVKLSGVSVLTKTQKLLLELDKLYLNVNLWPLFLRREIVFRLDLYPQEVKEALTFKGVYRIKERLLSLNSKIANTLFRQPQTIQAEATALIKKERSEIELELASPDLDLRGKFHIKGKDLRIEQLSGEIADSAFEFIGDAQDLPKPSLNIYGNLEVELAGLKKFNPEYIKLSEKPIISGSCAAEVFIAGKAASPRIDLKMNSPQVEIEQAQVRNLSIVAAMKEKQLSVSRLYAKLCEGEINLMGECRLDSQNPTANLDLNLSNMEINQLFRDLLGKDTPVHGRLFALAKLEGPLKDLNSVQGKAWVNLSGSNILQFSLFKGLGEVLRFPELREVKFKEAGGNFAIFNQSIQTNDFKIASDSVIIYFKGNMDFKGNLGFVVEPSFSEKLLATESTVGQLLGKLFDSTTGSFMGELKLKGNLKEPHYSFKPISPEKLLQKGLQELFDF